MYSIYNFINLDIFILKHLISEKLFKILFPQLVCREKKSIPTVTNNYSITETWHNTQSEFQVIICVGEISVFEKVHTVSNVDLKKKKSEFIWLCVQVGCYLNFQLLFGWT